MHALTDTDRPLEATPSSGSAAALLAQARSLRTQARKVNPILAEAYLRRAAELSLEAWARAAHDAPISPDPLFGDTVHAAAAAA